MIEALSKDYNLHVLTTSDIKSNLSKINERYKTSINSEDFVQIRLGFLNNKMPRLNKHACMRYLKMQKDKFDLYISSVGKMDFGLQGVQFIHYPSGFYIQNSKTSIISEFKSKVLNIISGKNKSNILSNKSIFNSYWTFNNSKDIPNPKIVIHSPVIQFKYIPENKKNYKFLVISRFVKEKNIDFIISIFNELLKENEKYSLTIVGNTSNKKDPYYLDIKHQINQNNRIILKEDISNSELADEIQTSRFGIHAHFNEHFGLSSVEMMSGGVIPFIPNDGGQVELHPFKECIYSSYEDAVQKIKIFTKMPNEELNKYGEVLSKHASGFKQENWKKKFIEFCEK